MQHTLPFLVYIAALAGAATGIAYLWNQYVGPFLGMTLLKDIRREIGALSREQSAMATDVREVKARIKTEFENGVDATHPNYVPMRRSLDRYIKADDARWQKHDEEAAGVRARLDHFNSQEATK